MERISKAVPASRAFAEHGLGDAVGVFEHVLVGIGGADGADDAFADAGDDGFLGGAADEAVEVGADGDARLDLEPMPSLATPSMVARPMAGLGQSMTFGLTLVVHGLEHGLAGAAVARSMAQARLKVERDARFVRGDERLDRVLDIAAGQVVGLEQVGRDVDPGFDRGDAGIDDEGGRHAAKAHPDELAHAYRRSGNEGANVKAGKAQDDRDANEQDDGDDADDHEGELVGMCAA